MIEIWGRRNSSNVVPVLWAVAESGVAFVRHDAGGSFGGLDAPQYRAMNPNGLVPTLVDDGFVVWESIAIIRYLAAKYGAGGLWPTDPAERSLADRWMDWCTTTLWVALRPVFHGLIRTSPENRDMEAITAAAKSTGEILAILDDWLADRDFVCGDAFTMGDIPVGFVLYRWYALDVEHPERPNVRAWYERLTERPGYREYIMIPLE